MTGDQEVKATGSTVTVELRHGDKFLLVKRPADDAHYAGYWAFPGGRVHADETFISAAERECEEETGLPLTGRLYFVDSYPLEGTTRTGIHFTFEVSDDTVRTDEFPEFKWVRSVEEMADLTPRIAGIDNHAEYSARRLASADQLSGALDLLELLQEKIGPTEPADIPALREALETLTWANRQEAHLVRSSYRNT
jgi:8-oxo-dGTP pyrophosphatase MutT (NUDIX family)